MPAIGIFDSGIGGLTVLRALKEALPDEAFVYLGDTARLPYGSKSPETIRRYLMQNIEFLLRQNVKALVVACNTASTVLHEDIWKGLPIYGVIKPGARNAVTASKGKIGILGTRATVNSNAYVDAIRKIDPSRETFQQACPLLVPLVEEGWQEDPVTVQVVSRYLEAPLAAGVDTLILGCTHYPVLKHLIAQIAGPEITLIDSAQAIAHLLRQDLELGRIPRSSRARAEVWTSDPNPYFQLVGDRILAPFTVDAWRQADISLT